MAVDDAELLVLMRNRKAPTTALLGLELESLDSSVGRTRYRMQVDPKFCNPMGSLQGGIVTTALDDAAATAVIARAQRRVGVPTIEFKVSFFGPAKLGQTVWFEGRVLKYGRTITFAEADMLDADHRLLARMSTSVMVVDLDGPGLFVETGKERS
ncbi:MAG: PaaI family thioesterase [Sandaracinobacteroides sp.]